MSHKIAAPEVGHQSLNRVISGVKEQHHTRELDIHVVGRPDLLTLTRKESTSASSMAIAGLRHLTGCS